MRLPDRDTSRLSLPGPMRDTPLVRVKADDQEAVPAPAVTWIVSPREADDKHDLIDVSSGVLVHVGLDPVHAPSAKAVHHKRGINRIPIMCMVFSFAYDIPCLAVKAPAFQCYSVAALQYQSSR
jgi:hypothetical protein